MNEYEYKLGELFCGPGGMALGAHLAAEDVPDVRIQHEWASDYDQSTVDTYVHNIPGASIGSVPVEDVRTLDVSRLGDIDGFAFGFPCNDFSVVGEHRGLQGSYGPLFQYGINVLHQKQPKWFVAENVGGLTGANGGKAFQHILKEMQGAGYVPVVHKYKFEKYGVPQARHRIIVVGIRNDLAEDGITFEIPDSSLKEYVPETASQAITIPKIPEAAFNHEFTRQSAVVRQRLELIAPGENAFTADLPEHLRLNVKGARLSQIYKRLDPSKPAYTVTGSGGGGTHVYHWSEPRALTNRERARLQTFPDWFEFKGSKESVRKQIGMAVPPRGAKVIFKALFRSLQRIPYPSIEPNLTIPGVQA
ncbi:DNA cytosine methyltransferase [Brevibacterium linens]|uniref:Cytosine-specific methyltransferase n=1 Tax=Brevibacterium linens ATCC 9172 TaxID=1255617 RepID=A0A2H1KEI2_BRELN|nr:DNA cytosine methyltransferase [Brevibacterium linens]SMX97954.1 DNA (cytosine-5)-methyltransferase 1 [Brevibacterium linens ATCC 9172]